MLDSMINNPSVAPRQLPLHKGAFDLTTICCKTPAADDRWSPLRSMGVCNLVGDGAPTSRRLSVGFGDNKGLRYEHIRG